MPRHASCSGRANSSNATSRHKQLCTACRTTFTCCLLLVLVPCASFRLQHPNLISSALYWYVLIVPAPPTPMYLCADTTSGRLYR